MSKPTPSSTSQPANKPHTGHMNGAGGSHAIRDNFDISTWLLMGASLQCVLVILPIPSSYALLPALFLLGTRFLKTLLMYFGVLRHPYADGVLLGKTAVAFPESYDADSKKHDGGVSVIMLTARCNHPLGIFAPHFSDLGERMESLLVDLDTNAPANGFLGGNSFINSSDRSSGSENMTLCYFKTHEDVQAFAHGTHHREVWNWWNDLAKLKKVEHLSISHEVFNAPAGQWEGVYVNNFPSGLAGTNHWVVDEKGVGRWVNPRVKAHAGRMRTAKGRMGRSDGKDHDEYGKTPYVDV